MKRRILLYALMVCGACAALLLSSCTTTETRIAERQGAYNSMSATDRALVTQGRIREGMSQDAVYIAWGAPNQRGEGRDRGRSVETWIYFNTTAGDYYGPYGYGGYGLGYGGFGSRYGGGRYGGGYGGGFGGYYGHRHRSGRLHGGFYYDPFYDPFFYGRTSVVSYPDRTVSFQNGRAIAYQLLPPPRFY